MKISFIATIMALATALITSLAARGGEVMLSSNGHAIYQVKAGEKMLLLPVQESVENAHLRVLDGKQQLMQTLNVRLAIDRVDYYVPLYLNGDTRAIEMFVGNHGDIKDYLCWKEIKPSNAFDTTNRERFRPGYHHTPAYGWMNDPNGMFYKDGVYHLYYQWNPYGSQWENMTWGHSTSRDLIHWKAEPTAIAPDALGAIFSGSCVVDKDNTAGFGKDAVIAYYTGAGRSQTQCMAVSTDGGRSFTKYEHNPVLTAEVPDFRDPKVFWNDDIKRWNLILAAGQEMRIYSSVNLKDWTYESSFGTGYGNHDGVWECPDLMRLPVRGTDKSRWLLICNINPGGPFGGSATQYFVGDFDGRTFTCTQRDTRWMDYGKDHYATVTFSGAPDGRHIALAWMSNWQYAGQVPTKQFRSANSVPRDLDLFEDGGEIYCGVTPSRELLAMRGVKVKKLEPACEIEVELRGKTEITLSNAAGEQVVMTYDAAKREFAMDRTHSGDTGFSDDFAAVTTAPVHGKLKSLRIFVDHCSIEALDAEGRMAMTNLVFPSTPYTDVKVKGGKATIYSLKH